MNDLNVFLDELYDEETYEEELDNYDYISDKYGVDRDIIIADLIGRTKDAYYE
jgi:hypothetical protein